MKSRQTFSLFIRLSFLILLLFSLCTETYSQVRGIRYLDEVFQNFEIQTVTYRDTLQMDIYSPKDDLRTDRPVILYVHGGGFSIGTRDEKRYTDFCETMVRKGYVMVTMSYRLTRKGASFGCDFSAQGKIRVFDAAAQDVHSATKYLADNARALGINPDLISLAGSSAGAEAVLHAAYVRDANSVLGENFAYSGVISMAGAMINDRLITNDSAIPTQLFHGTCDDLVPYGTAPHHYCEHNTPGFLTLYGGRSIADRLAELGKGYYMVTGCNGGHEWNDKPMIEYSNLITDFMYHDVLMGETRQIHVIKKSDSPDKRCTDRGNELACSIK